METPLLESQKFLPLFLSQKLYFDTEERTAGFITYCSKEQYDGTRARTSKKKAAVSGQEINSSMA